MNKRRAWNPWAHAAHHWPHVTICTTAELPSGVAGLTNFRDAIWLAPHLNREQRSFHLTHELVHMERGRPSEDYREAEEKIVDRIAARRCIPLGALGHALQHSDDIGAISRILLASPRAVRVRMDTLSPEEHAFLKEMRAVAHSA